MSSVRITLVKIGPSGYVPIPGNSFPLERFGSVPHVGDRIFEITPGKATAGQVVYQVVHRYFGPQDNEPVVYLVVDDRPAVDGEFDLLAPLRKT